MKVSDNNAMRCPYMAGEMPVRPSWLCADCEIARDPAAAGDLGKHLNCAFLERKRKKASNTMKNQKAKKKTAKKASKRNQTPGELRAHQKKPEGDGIAMGMTGIMTMSFRRMTEE